MNGSRTAAYIIEELRGAERTAVSMDAKGLFPNIDQAIDCEILDISETGAKIELKNIDVMPDKFKLYVPETDTFNTCRIVWKEGNQIGVVFHSKLKLI